MEQAVTAALKLIENPERRAAMSQAALAFANANRGAAERTATALLAIAEAASPVGERAGGAAAGVGQAACGKGLAASGRPVS